MPGLGRIEERCRFLKKAAQKLLLCWAIGFVGDKPMAQHIEVFLLFFVHKKKPSPALHSYWLRVCGTA
jgi:hypothetical protein